MVYKYKITTYDEVVDCGTLKVLTHSTLESGERKNSQQTS